ncbi:MAG: CapA family protein [Oscillospiraceae bacterium]|nr:CapA family protein [Oscillospiraceae bacterium]
MLPDPEERKRKRQAEAEKRKAAQKKLMIGLIAGAGALVLTAILILAIVIGVKLSRREESQPDAPNVATQPVQTQPPKAEDTVIHFAATGDLNVTQALVEAGGPNNDLAKVILDVAPVLSAADLTTVNLEGDLSDYPNGEFQTAPKSLATVLRSAGVDMLQLANSYAINQGVSGLFGTMDAVQSAGMEPVGVFRSTAEYKEKQGFSMFEIQGVRIAVVAFTKGMNGDAIPGEDNENCVNVLYSDYNSVYQNINKDKISHIMNNIQDQKPDITIALVHWGSEQDNSISNSQKTIRDLLLAGGADAIIGTHSHQVQQIQYDPEAGTLVAYSLGDFISNGVYAESAYSIILDVEITKDSRSGEARISGYSYTPIFTVTEENKPVRVVRIAEAMRAYEEKYMEAVEKSTYEAMEKALKRIPERITAEVK